MEAVGSGDDSRNQGWMCIKSEQFIYQSSSRGIAGYVMVSKRIHVSLLIRRSMECTLTTSSSPHHTMKAKPRSHHETLIAIIRPQSNIPHP